MLQSSKNTGGIDIHYNLFGVITLISILPTAIAEENNGTNLITMNWSGLISIPLSFIITLCVLLLPFFFARWAISKKSSSNGKSFDNFIGKIFNNKWSLFFIIVAILLIWLTSLSASDFYHPLRVLLDHLNHELSSLANANIAQSTSALIAISCTLLLVVFISYIGITRGTNTKKWYNNPLGMPRGSIRAIIALLFVITLLLIAEPVSGDDSGQSEWLLGILGTIIGFYFGERGSETSKKESSEDNSKSSFEELKNELNEQILLAKMQTSVETNPQDYTTWNHKGRYLAKQGKYEEALQAFSKAIEINPQYADAYLNKGVTLTLLDS